MRRRVSSPAFIGRGEQLAAIAAAVVRADAGEAGAVFIGGEAGVGKTRLVTELERLPEAGAMRFLVGGCVDVGGSELPYAPLLGALRMLVRDTEPRVLEELVGPARDELARLLPEFHSDGPRIEAVDPLAQGRLFQALLGLFARAAPVVLVVEDLHWADPSTRGFLSFLVRNIGHERLLLVATYRTDELHRRHPLRQFLAEVERLPVIERVELSPFTRRELAQQLTAILDASPEPQLVEELLARSQGNAFFAEELLAASGDDGAHPIPESLRDALTLRVERLSPVARQTVRSAAVAGTIAGHRLLAVTAGLSDDELAGALREAIENNVLVKSGESYAFRHELLREALYDELLPAERVALHAKLARALEDDADLAVGAHGAAAQRAIHWSAAHEVAAALAASVQAGIEAEQVWSFAEANAHFEHAVELWAGVATEQRPEGLSLVDLLGRAADAAYLSGQNQRAVTMAGSALELLDPDAEPVAAGLAHARLGRYLLADAELMPALAEYRSAAALLPTEPSAARASILAGEAHILMLQGEAREARAPCEEAIRVAREVGAAEVECDALNTLGAVLVQLGALEEGIQALRRGQQLAMDLGALEELRRAYINLGQSLDDAGRLQEAAEVAREGWERLRSRIGTAAAFLAAEAGLRLIRLGHWDEALAVLEDAAETARPEQVCRDGGGSAGLDRSAARRSSSAQALTSDRPSKCSRMTSSGFDESAGRRARARPRPTRRGTSDGGHRRWDTARVRRVLHPPARACRAGGGRAGTASALGSRPGSGARSRHPSGGPAWLGADADGARGVAARLRARRVPVGGGALRTGDASGARGGSCRCVEHGCGTLGGAGPSLSRGVRAAARSRSGDRRGRAAGPGHGSPGVGPCHGRPARRPAVAEADRTGIPPGAGATHGGRARRSRAKPPASPCASSMCSASSLRAVPIPRSARRST